MVQPGIKAKKNFQSVLFYPFGNDPASSYILTADPFSYLSAWLDGQINVFERKGKTAKLLAKAKYFCELSESYNKSAENSNLPVKGTLLYYSFLNLVKTYLLVNGLDLENKEEHHGLSMPSNYNKKIKVRKKPSGSFSIFWEFSHLLGDKINDEHGCDITFVELLEEMPEVHEIGHALDIISTKRKFLPIDIQIMTNKSYNRLFYEFSFKDHQEHIIPVEKLTKNHFEKHIQKIDCYPESQRIHFRSKNKVNYKKGSNASWNRAYSKVTEELESIGATVMLTNSGYRYYMNLKRGKLHRLSALFALMFYLGTVARYRPSLYNDVLKGEYQPIINEVIHTCPKQFHYLMVSRITKQVCAIPMAKI